MVCEVVQTNGKGGGLLIWEQVGVCVVDGPHKTSCIVVTRHVFSEYMDHAGLGAVGDHLDGVDEVLRLCTE